MLKNASRLFTPDLEKASQICIRLKEMKRKKVWVGFGKTETECCIKKKVRSCLCRPRKQESRVWGIIVEAGVVILSLQVAKTKDSNDVERGG